MLGISPAILTPRSPYGTTGSEAVHGELATLFRGITAQGARNVKVVAQTFTLRKLINGCLQRLSTCKSIDQQKMLAFTSEYVASINLEWGAGFVIRSKSSSKPDVDDLPANAFCHHVSKGNARLKIRPAFSSKTLLERCKDILNSS